MLNSKKVLTRFQEVKVPREAADGLVRVYIVSPVLKLIAVVLHSAIKQFFPFAFVEVFDELSALFVCHEIIEDVEPRDGTSGCDKCLREVYNSVLLHIVLGKRCVEKHKRALVV